MFRTTKLPAFTVPLKSDKTVLTSHSSRFFCFHTPNLTICPAWNLTHKSINNNVLLFWRYNINGTFSKSKYFFNKFIHFRFIILVELVKSLKYLFCVHIMVDSEIFSILYIDLICHFLTFYEFDILDFFINFFEKRSKTSNS